MRNQILVMTGVALASSLVTLTTYAVPSILSYKEASSAYSDAYVTGHFNAADGNQERSNYDMDLAVDFEKVLSTPSRNIKYDFTASGTKSRSSKNGEEAKNTYQASGSATMDKYFRAGSRGAFWYGKGEVGAKKGQKKSFSKITAGLGYGRVVNVTPMARAIRVVAALRKNGSLATDPSNDTYQSIASIIAKEAQYRSQYGNKYYVQHWVADIEKAIGMSIGARGAIRANDVLGNERISTRKHGWLVRAGIGAVLSDYDGETGKPALEVGAEYHRPLSNQTQFSNEAIFTTTLKDSNSSYNVKNNMSLTHEITDVIDWENKWAVDYSKSDNVDAITNHTLTSAFNYELSNQLDYNVTATLVKTDGKDDLDKKLSMGIKYRLK
jgi:hypothetical protein